MQGRKTAIAVSLLIIALGIAWMLNVLKVTPGMDWFWPVGFGVSGILLLTVAGLDRFNFVVGVSFVVYAVLIVLRQKGILKPDQNIEAPLLCTTVGVLLFLAHLLKLPARAVEPKHSLADKPVAPEELPK